MRAPFGRVDPVRGRVARDAERVEQCDELRGGGRRIAEDLAQRGVARGVDAERRLHHGRQAERARDAVRDAARQRDRIGNAVRERGVRIREREPRAQRAERHVAARVEIVGVRIHAPEAVHQFACRLHGKAARDGVRMDVPDAFERVRQRVETAGERRLHRQADHQARIDDHRFRKEIGPRQRQLARVVRIPDGRPPRHFAAGAGRGRDRDDRQRRPHRCVARRARGAGQDAQHAIEIAVFGGEHFRRIDHRAAAERDQHVRFGGQRGEPLARASQHRHRRVRLDAVDPRERRPELRFDTVGQPREHGIGIRDDRIAASAERIAQIRERVDAEADPHGIVEVPVAHAAAPARRRVSHTCPFTTRYSA